MRAAGILLPIFSLYDDYGIGSFSKSAFSFVDDLVKAGQSYWQILPIGPVSFGYSPYQSYSTFAIEPLFIDIETLKEDGLLEQEDLYQTLPYMTYIDYEKTIELKYRFFEKAYNRFSFDVPEVEKFLDREKEWLDGFADFMVKHDQGKYENKFYIFLQYEADKQWSAIKAYANENNVKIIGDIPIYVSPDSADVEQNPKLFMLDDDGERELIAGVPGDGYAPDGQLWGNPLYDWEYHKETGYEWWTKRIQKALYLYDIVRIDHFRGFDEFFAIPIEDKNANRGKWLPGPGMSLFNALTEKLGELPVIAEDLGFLTDSVRQLLADSKFPGMKVMQFAFDGGPANEYLPHHYTRNSVVYTGTHDNMTLYGWVCQLNEWTLGYMKKYLGYTQDRYVEPRELTDRIIKLAHSTVADTCIVPLQDYFYMDNFARINTPSTIGGNNWRWMMQKDALNEHLLNQINDITKTYLR